jgi:hypothetical protein
LEATFGIANGFDRSFTPKVFRILEYTLEIAALFSSDPIGTSQQGPLITLEYLFKFWSKAFDS